MLKVGITGGIASGKSLACSVFEVLGIAVYYADLRAKELIVEDPDIRTSIIDLLGEAAYHNDGTYNTKYVGNIVFNNKDKLIQLNKIVHPKVKEDYFKWSSLQSGPYCLHESALIIEGGFYKWMDKLIVVTSPEELRVRRIIHRDHVSEEEAVRRIRSQLPEIEKIKKADFIINNDEIRMVTTQCIEIHQLLTCQLE